MATLSTLSSNLFVASGSDCNRPQSVGLTLFFQFLTAITLSLSPLNSCQKYPFLWICAGPESGKLSRFALVPRPLVLPSHFPALEAARQILGPPPRSDPSKFFQKSNRIPFYKQLYVNSISTFLIFTQPKVRVSQLTMISLEYQTKWVPRPRPRRPF